MLPASANLVLTGKCSNAPWEIQLAKSENMKHIFFWEFQNYYAFLE